LCIIPTFFQSTGNEDDDDFAGLEAIELVEQDDAIKLDDDIDCNVLFDRYVFLS
jgi:hypothetical protein